MHRRSIRPMIWCLIAAMLILALFGFRWDKQCHDNGSMVVASNHNGKAAAE